MAIKSFISLLRGPLKALKSPFGFQAGYLSPDSSGDAVCDNSSAPIVSTLATRSQAHGKLGMVNFQPSAHSVVKVSLEMYLAYIPTARL